MTWRSITGSSLGSATPRSRPCGGISGWLTSTSGTMPRLPGGLLAKRFGWTTPTRGCCLNWINWPRDSVIRRVAVWTDLHDTQALVDQRDDLSLEYVTLLNVVDRHQQAWEYLLARNFHPWEGGEGKVPAQYTLCLTQLARKSIAASELDAALGWLRRADDWPHCLGEGKLPNHQDNNVRYWQGVALTKLGREAEAREALERAAQGMSQPSDPMYYNDQPPDMIFYQGRALKSLDRHAGSDGAIPKSDRLWKRPPGGRTGNRFLCGFPARLSGV